MTENRVYQSFKKVLSLLVTGILCFFAQTPQFQKICFICYRPKCSLLIKLQNSLILNFSGRNESISQDLCIILNTPRSIQSISQIFYVDIVTNESQSPRLPLLDERGQACPATPKVPQICYGYLSLMCVCYGKIKIQNERISL